MMSKLKYCWCFGQKAQLSLLEGSFTLPTQFDPLPSNIMMLMEIISDVAAALPACREGSHSIFGWNLLSWYLYIYFIHLVAGFQCDMHDVNKCSGFFVLC